MKVTVREKNAVKEYPYIGITLENTVVLFTIFKTGVCLSSNAWSVGKYSDTWQEENFKPFEGEIVLSND